MFRWFGRSAGMRIGSSVFLAALEEIVSAVAVPGRGLSRTKIETWLHHLSPRQQALRVLSGFKTAILRHDEE